MVFALRLALGAVAGIVVGLLIGGLTVTWKLGLPLNSGDPLILLTGFPGWPEVTDAPWSTGWLIVVVSTAAFAAFALLLSVTARLTEYGQAHFQSRAEMKRNGLLKPLGAGLVFGKLGTPSSRKPFVAAEFAKFPHCLVVAPTRAGKGVGYVIPNTLLFPGSAVILDVKGEIFEATARHRQAQGDRVFRFAPFDFENATHRYNPLERVARIENPEQRYTELAKIADYFLTVSDKGTASDFLMEGRELFVAAGLLAIERGRPTLGEVSRILFAKGATQSEYAAHAEEVRHGAARNTFRKFAGYSDRTLSSHASVLGGAGMSLWNNPAVDRATSANDIAFGTLRKLPQTIYVAVNADDIRTLSPLIRLFFGELIATLRGSLPDPKAEPWPVMILLDEFDQLGPMPIVEQALKQLAGHGARVSIITQSIPGLDNIYGENVRLSLESAAGMKLYLSPNEKKTAQEVSDALGKTTKLATSDSYARDASLLTRRSLSRRMEERPLMSADEVKKLDANIAILIPERQQPLRVRRIVYYEDAVFRAIYAAQAGPLPYPVRQDPEVAILRAEVAALRLSVTAGAKGVVAFRSGDADGIAAEVVDGVAVRLEVSEEGGQMQNAAEVIARMRAFDEAISAGQ
ncbi:type IV secretion system protein VirD4 [Gemmobacter caeni]|uniref:Type IV secretion system protein VirD4 n=1 Tax=Gemmobacter caeni TaxID=589035 RepID=A0A2T6ADD9_9RHOB|nr:type IV secretory system conjugative DNA transfer family protein [Gemmobacter caeni]PTX41828.1 type IV secretion system protein VirD4 [Gemmobacter caeni]TWI90609.1 type IV secretion system protein VirD4 [Gemmobacter caeni]